MRPSLRWSLLLLASSGAGTRAAEACSCLRLDAPEPGFRVWPSAKEIPRNARIWVHRGPRAKGTLGLFVDGKPFPAAILPAAGAFFEVAAEGLFPPRSAVELRADGSMIRSFRAAEQSAERLADRGELLGVETWDGDAFEPCGNGSPRAVLSFSRFSVAPASRPVPYAIWSGRGPEPLDLRRPPDRLIFVDDLTYPVDGGSICKDGDYWLPTGEGEMRLAAAAIDPDGTRHPPREVSFPAALTAGEKEERVGACRTSAREARARLLAEVTRLDGEILPVARRRRLVNQAAAALGALGALLLGAALWRRSLPGRKGLAALSIVSFSLASAAALAGHLDDGRLAPLQASRQRAVSESDAQDGGPCLHLFDHRQKKSFSPRTETPLTLPPASHPTFVAEAEARAAELAPLFPALLDALVPDCKKMPGQQRETSPARDTPLARREDVLQVQTTCTRPDKERGGRVVHHFPDLRPLPPASRSSSFHHTAGTLTIACPSTLVDDELAFDVFAKRKTDADVGVRVAVRGAVGCFTDAGKEQGRRRKEAAQALVDRHGQAMLDAIGLVSCPDEPGGFMAPKAALAPLSSRPGVVAASVGCLPKKLPALWMDEDSFGTQTFVAPGREVPWGASEEGLTFVALGKDWVRVDTPFSSIADLKGASRLRLLRRVRVALVVEP